jgi:hypothetical protein
MSDNIDNKEQENLELMKAIVKVLAELREKVDALAMALDHERVLEGNKMEGFRDRISQQSVIRDVDKQTSARNLTGLVRQLGGKLRNPPRAKSTSRFRGARLRPIGVPHPSWRWRHRRRVAFVAGRMRTDTRPRAGVRV